MTWSESSTATGAGPFSSLFDPVIASRKPPKLLFVIRISYSIRPPRSHGNQCHARDLLCRRTAVGQTGYHSDLAGANFSNLLKGKEVFSYTERPRMV